MFLGTQNAKQGFSALIADGRGKQIENGGTQWFSFKVSHWKSIFCC